MIRGLRPAHALLFGYFLYVCIGTILLSLSISQQKSIPWLDHLFIATSAVSTTGLATVDPGSSYTWFGQVVIVLLIQLGGLGYMTVSSFVILAANRKLSDQRISILKSAFSLPRTIGITHFVRDMIAFTVLCELIGTAALYPYLREASVENPLWSSLFHSVSAFCTAGFSLFPTSFETFRGHVPVNLILAWLSYAGGIGFIVFTDVWSKIRDRNRRLTFTTKIILSVTFGLSFLGTVGIYLLEPSLRALPFMDGVLAAFFQTMSASTTVGFNTIPISKISLPVATILYFLMFFGASPAGTGGGLKSTTLTALLAEVWSQLRGYPTVSLAGREIPENRVRAASMSATSYIFVLGAGVFALTVVMPLHQFEWMVFEAISALGTVGLSMGLTSELNTSGKWVIIALMFIGRVGVVTVGLSFTSPKATVKFHRDDLAV